MIPPEKVTFDCQDWHAVEGVYNKMALMSKTIRDAYGSISATEATVCVGR